MTIIGDVTESSRRKLLRYGKDEKRSGMQHIYTYIIYIYICIQCSFLEELCIDYVCMFKRQHIYIYYKCNLPVVHPSFNAQM